MTAEEQCSAIVWPSIEQSLLDGDGSIETYVSELVVTTRVKLSMDRWIYRSKFSVVAKESVIFDHSNWNVIERTDSTETEVKKYPVRTSRHISVFEEYDRNWPLRVRRRLDLRYSTEVTQTNDRTSEDWWTRWTAADVNKTRKRVKSRIADARARATDWLHATYCSTHVNTRRWRENKNQARN